MPDDAPRPNRSTEELRMREIVVARLRSRWPSARIIHELPTRYSSNRIDVAAVTRNEIVGVEIKSSRDTADRLEAQLRAFEPITTRLIVALAPKWNVNLPAEQRPIIRKGVQRGIAYVPRRTEAQEAINRSGVTSLEVWTVCADAGLDNATAGGSSYFRSRDPWPARLLDILHVAELEAIATRHPVGFRTATHDGLVRALLTVLPTTVALREACRALRARNAFDAASDPPIPPDAPDA